MRSTGRGFEPRSRAVARRPAETSRELSAQATALYIVGGVVEPIDRQYMSRILPETAMSKAMNLPRYHYLKYQTDGTYTILPPVKII